MVGKGYKNLIATTRTPDNLPEFSRGGVEIRFADFKEPGGLESAFTGATRLLLISAVDVGSRVEQHGAAIEAAIKAGVKHVVYTSSPRPGTSVAQVAPDHAGTEELIRKSGLKYTFLENYMYSEVLMYRLPQALKLGVLYGCAGDGKAAYVTRQDCASAATGVLGNPDRHENKEYLVSGPKAYSHSELAALVSEVTGKEWKYVDLQPEKFKTALVQASLSGLHAELLTSFEPSIKRGELAQVTNDVQELSGRPPESLPQFLESALAA